jgi:hypothetical protein
VAGGVRCIIFPWSDKLVIWAGLHTDLSFDLETGRLEFDVPICLCFALNELTYLLNFIRSFGAYKFISVASASSSTAFSMREIPLCLLFSRTSEGLLLPLFE